MAEITMPPLGENVTEGTIGRWLKQPGEQIVQDEPLVEVTTDKVNTEVPSPISGTLATIIAEEGATVAVGAQIATITSTNEAANSAEATGTDEPVPTPEPVMAQAAGEASAPAAVAPPVSTEATPALPNAAAPAQSTNGDFAHAGGNNARNANGAGRRRFTPIVERLAEQHEIPLSELHAVPGSGLGGRVNKQDLLTYIEQQGKVARPLGATATAPPPVTAPPAATTASAAPSATKFAQPQSQPPRPAATAGTTLPLTPMRRAIGDHMVRSLATAPHAWTMIEVDMTALVRYRAAHKAQFQAREGYPLSYVPFVITATIGALQEFPILNASLTEAGIVLKRALNIGLAVALPEQQGLIVPVIKGADGLSLLGLARAVNDLATRARANSLTTADLQDGTFTVNNPGTYGSILSQPIINQPQAAILTMEAIVKRPVVLTDSTTGDDTIAIRSMMNICLSFDHRIFDGQTAGQFLASVRQHLERFDSSTAL